MRLDEEVYERVRAHKRDDETVSEAITRLMGDVSLLDLADEDEPHDEETAAARKETLRRTARSDSEEAAEVSDGEP
ncbi:hypothetical protein BRC97_05930 [Halobacteriales archaeon QS_6_71_20]|nr:MAG: hypothetical protein BRC97_05930 [Halobacteriales archaeon QS_6_71_20]